MKTLLSDNQTMFYMHYHISNDILWCDHSPRARLTYSESPMVIKLNFAVINGGVTQLEPHILECEDKLILGSSTMNKTSGSDGIPAELFQILKDDGVKVLHSTYQQIWKNQQLPQDWKISVFILIPKQGNAKKYSTTTQLHAFHRLAK